MVLEGFSLRSHFWGLLNTFTLPMISTAAAPDTHCISSPPGSSGLLRTWICQEDACLLCPPVGRNLHMAGTSRSPSPRSGRARDPVGWQMRRGVTFPSLSAATLLSSASLCSYMFFSWSRYLHSCICINCSAEQNKGVKPASPEVKLEENVHITDKLREFMTNVLFSGSLRHILGSFPNKVS